MPQDSPSGFTSPFFPTTHDIENVQNIMRYCILPPRLRTVVSVAVAPDELKPSGYDAEIAVVAKELQRLRAERATLSRYAENCCSVMAPVRRMPDESLVEIFAFCHPLRLYDLMDNATPKDEVHCAVHRHLLELGKVCFHWYHLAMRTPKLWSKVSLNTYWWDKCDVPSRKLLDLLAPSLARGRNHDLVLRLGFTHGGKFNNGVLELLCRHAHRWRDVYIWAGCPSPGALSNVIGNLDRLQALKLDASCPDIKAFQDAPVLRLFRFKGKFEDIPCLPWDQIQMCKHFGAVDNSYALPLPLLPLAAKGSTFELRMDLRNRPVG
ncbi:hypothetical protein R3P38DRAFT_3440085 [Favolaschia claudopus]|uniref:F-box domain-containing protein n=1 Tax=Favolaschia claudopus TaxID=2862362 RepID=A0AAW0CW67_9AGAR